MANLNDIINQLRNPDTLEAGILSLTDTINEYESEKATSAASLQSLQSSNDQLRNTNALLLTRITGNTPPMPEGEDPDAEPKPLTERYKFFKEVSH